MLRALEDVWWLDTWSLPPQVVDEMPAGRAHEIQAVKTAIEQGRELAQDDARRDAERSARRR